MDDAEFGNALVARGLVSDEELREAMWERDRRERLGGHPPFLWDLLIERGNLSRLQVDEILASMQKRSRFCAECNVAVPVPRVTHEGERCARCGGPVSWRALGARQTQDTMVLIQGKLPSDVELARSEASRCLGKYVLVEEAGKGGAGIVYKAWDLVLGQYVALKLVRKIKSDKLSREDLIKDLLVEARNSIRLRHPNIVPVFDAGRFGEEFYICMEYVEGDPLAAHIRAAQARGRLSPLYEDAAQAMEMMRDVAMGIHYAHTFPKPIVHCDMKPGNILIDTRNHAYIVDFGLAQPADVPAQTGEGAKTHVRGTPAYMAPEQLTGKREDIGPWTDIYALGSILYELMAGRQVFDGTAYEMLHKAVNVKPTPPLEAAHKNGELKRDNTTLLLLQALKLDALAMQCLEKDRGKRPPSAKAIADELERMASVVRIRLTSETQQAAPPARINAAPIQDKVTRFDLEKAFQEIGDTEFPWDAGDLAAIATDQRRQLRCLEDFRARMVAKINAMRPKVAKLELLDGTVLPGVELLRATRKMVVAFHRGQSIELAWAALKPVQLVALAADVLKLGEPADRLALALYAINARLFEIAKAFLSSLDGTPLKPAADALRTTVADS